VHKVVGGRHKIASEPRRLRLAAAELHADTLNSLDADDIGAIVQQLAFELLAAHSPHRDIGREATLC